MYISKLLRLSQYEAYRYATISVTKPRVIELVQPVCINKVNIREKIRTGEYYGIQLP